MTHANNADNQNVELFAQDWAALNECALWTHEQGSLSALQEGLLKRIADVIVHRVSMFDIAQTGAHGQTQFVRPVAYGMSAQALDDYYERYAAYDYTIWSFDTRVVDVYRDLDLVDVERRNGTPIYLEWMQPWEFIMAARPHWRTRPRRSARLRCSAPSKTATLPIRSSRSSARLPGT